MAFGGLRNWLRKAYEAVTPQNEASIRASNQTIQQVNQNLAQNGAKYGPLRDPVRRQQFIQQNQPVRFNLPKVTAQSVVTKGIPAVGLGIGRSAVGTLEGLSGTYDLLTPGVGRNRFTQKMNAAGGQIDDIANRNQMGGLGYRAAQFAGEAAAFLTPGTVAKGIQVGTKVPGIAKGAKFLSSTTPLINKPVLKYVSSPSNIVNTAVATARSQGYLTAREQDVSPQSIAMGAGTNVILGAGLNVFGSKVIDRAKQSAPKAIQTAKSAFVNPQVRQLDDHIATLQASKRGKSVRTQNNIDKAIAAAQAERYRINQGGYVRLPGGESKSPQLPPSDGNIPQGKSPKIRISQNKLDSSKNSIQDPLEALKAEARKYKSAEEFTVAIKRASETADGHWNKDRTKWQVGFPKNKLTPSEAKIRELTVTRDLNNPTPTLRAYKELAESKGYSKPEKVITDLYNQATQPTAPVQKGAQTTNIAKQIEAENQYLEANRGKRLDDGMQIPADYKAYRRTVTGDTVDVKRLKTDPQYFKEAYESTFARGYGTDEKLYKTLTKELVPKGKEPSSYLAEMYKKSSVAPPVQKPLGEVAQQPKNPTIPQEKIAITKAQDPNLVTSKGKSQSGANVSLAYNTNNLKISKAKQKQAVKIVKEIKPALNKRIGETLSNKEVQEAAENSGIILQHGASREQTKKAIAANLKLREKIALGLKQEKVSPDTIAAMLEDKAAGADIARQLQARRINAVPKDRAVLDLMIEKIQKAGVATDEVVKASKNFDLNDPAQQAEFYRMFVKPTAEDWLDKYRYTNMLSSPLTHIVNITSNAQGIAGIHPVQKLYEGGIDATKALVTGGKRTRFAGESKAYFGGVKDSVGAAMKEFSDVMKGNTSIQNPDIDSLRNVPLATKGIKGTADKILSGVTKLLEASDRFGTTLVEGGEKRALQYRQGKGIKIANIDSQAVDSATYRLFRKELGNSDQGHFLQALDAVPKAVNEWRNSSNPVVRNAAKFTFPFISTPTNLFKQGFEYSPLGVLTMPGNVDKIAQAAKMTMGTTVMGITSGLLAAGGDLTFNEPSNPDERNRFRAEGKQPYAVRIGGKWYGYSKLHPAIAFNLAIFAAVKQAQDEKKLDDNAADQFLQSAAGILGYFRDQSYMKSIGDVTSVFQSKDGSSWGDVIASQASNTVNQFVPFKSMVSWIGRQIDPTQRKVDYTAGTLDQIYQNVVKDIPILNSAVQPRTDPRTGDVIKSDYPTLNAFSPIRITQDKGTNPLDAQMDAIKQATAKDPLLTDKQTKDIEKIATKSIYQAQQELIKDPKFQQLSDEDKKSSLERLAKDIKAVERRKYMSDNKVGEYSQDFTGKETKLTKQQSNIIKSGIDTSKYSRPSDSKYTEIPAGMNGYDVQTLERFSTLNDEEKDNIIRTEPDAEYKLTLAEYERDKKLGKISKVEDIKRTNELKKAEVGKTYAKEIREFYSINKDDIYNYISSQPDGQAVAQQLLAYDDALVKAGVIDKNKFRDKYGNIAFVSSKSGRGRGGRKGRGSKIPSIKIAKPRQFAKIKTGTTKAPSVKLNTGTVRIAKKKANTKINAPKIRIA